VTEAGPGRVQVAGRLAACRTAGRGRAVVLVHGAAGAGGLWTAQVEALAGVARVAAPDLPGHGESEGPGERTVGAYADFLVRLLDALGMPRAVLVGHSMGGAIALAVALDHPGRVDGLALVASGARLRVLPRLLELLRARPAEGLDLVAELACAPETPRARVAAFDRALRATPTEVTLGDFLACDGFDATARLGEVAVPALVLVGREDRLTPPRWAAALAAGLAGARLVEVPAAGHCVHLEQPEAVGAQLVEFLASVPAAGPGRAGAA
jgi:pimeloyl-ACP methyl ester carboxylesterase